MTISSSSRKASRLAAVSIVAASIACLLPWISCCCEDFVAKGLVAQIFGAFFLGSGLTAIVISIILLARKERDKFEHDAAVAKSILVLLPIITLVASIVVAAYLAYRMDETRSLCINNLRLIDHAKEVLAIKNGWTNGQIIAETQEAIWAALDPHIDGTDRPCCPKLRAGTHYVYGPIGVIPKCQYGKDHVYESH